MTARYLIPLFVCLVAACAGPEPVLYPNAHLERVGTEQAEKDIERCREMAETGGARAGDGKGERVAKETVVGGAVGAATGAIGGAVVGSVGSGSAVGAAIGGAWGLFRGLFSSPGPSQAYINFVNRCLHDKGYETTGWD